MCQLQCPKCGEVFKADEAGYAAILKQVHDQEFEKELLRLREQFDAEKKSNADLVRAELEAKYTKIAAEGNIEIERLKTQISETEKRSKQAAEAVGMKKDSEIAELKARLSAVDAEKRLAVSDAKAAGEKAISEKDMRIADLERTIDSMNGNFELEKQRMTDAFKATVKLKDEQIEQYRDFKARMSTKMVGESLERHCEDEFNKLRAAGFRDAYFEKDNDARTGSKGDYIFRDYVDGTEYVSIMFEMKNETDGGVSAKHRNEDFLKELDKDRNEKGCEYAVLVSMLEPESELYNSGIVDMSHRYPKMYVIRPQFFVPMITLLRNAALNSLEYRKKLAVVQSQQVDIFNFEANLTAFKDSFARSFNQASARFEDSIKGIDSTISALTKIRENLVKSENHLNAANNKLENVSIRKLTTNSPSVRAMFEDKKDET